jgi:hypothetical protein
VTNVVSPDTKTVPAEQPVKASRNIFEDPAIAAAAQNDPFVRFVIKHGKTILVSLIALALGMIAVNRFTVTQQSRKAQVTQEVRAIQKEYEALAAKLDELESLKGELSASADQAEKIKGLEGDIKQLKEKGTLKLAALEASGSFPEVARLYRGLFAARTGELDKAKEALASVSWEQYPAASSERLVAELASLALAKSLVDSEVHRDVAQKALVALAERGTVAAAQAVLALQALARTDEERGAVDKLTEGVQKRLPSQRKFLSGVSED